VILEAKQISLLKKTSKHFLFQIEKEAVTLTPLRLMRLIVSVFRKNWKDQIQNISFFTGESHLDSGFYYALNWNSATKISVNDKTKFWFDLSAFKQNEELLFQVNQNRIYAQLPLKKIGPKHRSGFLILEFAKEAAFNPEILNYIEQIRSGIAFALFIRRFDINQKIYRPFPEE